MYLKYPTVCTFSLLMYSTPVKLSFNVYFTLELSSLCKHLNKIFVYVLKHAFKKQMYLLPVKHIFF